MTETAPKLSLVPEGDTPWRLEHATPGRIRISSDILLTERGRCEAFCEQLRPRKGINRVNANARLGTATIHYSHRRLTQRDLGEQIRDALEYCLVPPEPAAGDAHLLDDGQLLALLSALVVTPILPLPLRYAVTLGAISPSLWHSLTGLRQGGSAKQVLDTSALLLTTVAGRYGVAQINNLMHVLGQRLEKQAVAETESRLRTHGREPQADYQVIRDGERLSSEARWLQAGDRLLLEGGDIVPLECVVTGGEARINAGFTADELDIGKGQRIASGSYLHSGEIEVACLQAWPDGNYARIASFIEIAVRSREDHELYAAGLADRLVPFSALLSAAVYGFTRDLGRASSALQADFSASHEMVTPVSVESTIAAGAANGILFRGGPAIEGLAEIDTLVFDRSGTFTSGEWQLVKVATVGKHTEKQARLDLERLVYSCCRQAAGITADGDIPPLLSLSHAEIQQIQQHGLHMRRGNRDLGLMDAATARQRFDVELPQELTPLDRIGSLFCLLVNGNCAAVVRFSDSLSPGNVDAINALRKQGVDNVYLLSHERANNLHPELSRLPLDGFHTSFNELEKLHFVQGLLDRGNRVAVVSDGLLRGGSDCLNICLGSSADARPLDADLWLMSASIDSLVTARDLAMRSATQLKSSHRLSQAGRGAMLLASSFDLLPPSVAAALGNAATLAAMRLSRNIHPGEPT